MISDPVHIGQIDSFIIAMKQTHDPNGYIVGMFAATVMIIVLIMLVGCSKQDGL